MEFTGLESLASESPFPFTTATPSSESATTPQASAVWSPSALFELADLALVGDLSAEAALRSAVFDLPSYLEFAARDVTLLPRLAILAELGCENVQSLLEKLVSQGPQNFFFSVAGVAGEGSRVAFSILNRTATFDHLATLIGFAEVYSRDAVFGPMLLRVIQSPDFRPSILDLAAHGDAMAGAFVAKLAELGNPLAAEWLRVPTAANWQ